MEVEQLDNDSLLGGDDDFEMSSTNGIMPSKKRRTVDDLVDETDYSVSELLVELEWNPIENKSTSKHEDSSHAPRLSRALGELVKKGQLCDLTVLVENGGLIPVHSCVMAASSPVLGERLTKANPPIQVLQLSSLPGLGDVQRKALVNDETVRNLLINFAYFGSLEKPKDIFEDFSGFDSSHVDRTVRLLAGAMALQMEGAVVIAMDMLKSLMDVASCLSIFIASWHLGCVELETVAVDYIDRHFSKIALEQSWVDAPAEIVQRVLCRSELQARDEAEVFRALARWCLEDFDRRGAMFRALVFDPMVCRPYLLQDEDLDQLLQHELAAAFPDVHKKLADEVERRRTGIKPDNPALHIQRKFLAVNDGSSTAVKSLEYPSLVPAQQPARLRGRSASVILNAPNSTSQPRKDIIVSNVTVLSGHEKAVCALAVNENWVVSGSSDATIRVWEIKTWRGGTVLRGHEDSVSSLKFINNRLVSGSFDRSIRVWNVSTWKAQGHVAQVAHGDPVTCLSVVARTNQLASGSAGGEIKIWSLINPDTEEWRPVFFLQNAHAHVLWSCCEWGSTIVSGSSDKEIRVWDSTTWTLKARFTNHKDEVQALLVIGDELYSGSDDGVIAVHSSYDQTGGPTRFVELNRPVMALAEYQSLLAVGFGDGGIVLLNAANLSKFGELKGHTASVMSLVTRGELLLSGSFDKSVRVWKEKDD